MRVFPDDLKWRQLTDGIRNDSRIDAAAPEGSAHVGNDHFYAACNGQVQRRKS
jgi:hypothetical protein